MVGSRGDDASIEPSVACEWAVSPSFSNSRNRPPWARVVGCVAALPQDSAPVSELVFLAPVAFSIGLFAWLALSSWARQRRLEREFFYRNELYRTLAERGEMGAADLHRLRNEDHARRVAVRHQGRVLAGLVLVAIGGGMLFAFAGHDVAVSRRLGVLPLAAGAAVLGHAWFGRDRGVLRAAANTPSEESGR